MDDVLVPQVAHDGDLLHHILAGGAHVGGRASVQAAVAHHGRSVDHLHCIQLLVLAVHAQLDLAEGARPQALHDDVLVDEGDPLQTTEAIGLL